MEKEGLATIGGGGPGEAAGGLIRSGRPLWLGSLVGFLWWVLSWKRGPERGKRQLLIKPRLCGGSGLWPQESLLSLRAGRRIAGWLPGWCMDEDCGSKFYLHMAPGSGSLPTSACSLCLNTFPWTWHPSGPAQVPRLHLGSCPCSQHPPTLHHWLPWLVDHPSPLTDPKDWGGLTPFCCALRVWPIVGAQ